MQFEGNYIIYEICNPNFSKYVHISFFLLAKKAAALASASATASPGIDVKQDFGSYPGTSGQGASGFQNF